MSVQFGVWNFDDMPAAPEHIGNADALLASYGPEGGSSYRKGGLTILYRAFHTTSESRPETQPMITASGRVITWDGRLDNRREFVNLLRNILSPDSADVSIVAAAYERWGTECFSRFLGDWALSIWDPSERSVILAKDPMGLRHLHYSVDQKQFAWSTILDPLVLLSRSPFALDEEFVAGWLAFFPAANRTPYIGIQSVPPSSFVLVRNGKHTVHRYWDFDAEKTIHYKTDAEYEEHFRVVLGESVRRRLRSDAPILAELSGGIDSSAIVCLADALIALGSAESPRLDTVSYYNVSEPNWNEQPYFAKVEGKRNRTGCHINFDSPDLYDFGLESNRFVASPRFCGRCSEADGKLADWMACHGNRILLSGTGGDEVTGGVPTPTPELADLVATAQFGRLACRLRAWAVNKRKPWSYLLFETLRRFFPPHFAGVPRHRRPAPWLDPQFVRRHRAAFNGYEPRLKVFGAPPSFQENIATLDSLRRQLGCTPPAREVLCEKRYPYLDRDLLEFLYAIPRDQLVRPGQRRSLMRRALVGIVPDEILSRKRKAFVIRAPMIAISAAAVRLVEMSRCMVSSSLGIVDAERFRNAITAVRSGQEVPIVPFMRTLSLEYWLEHLARRKVLLGFEAADYESVSVSGPGSLRIAS
ncbi:MAG: asparagine synthase-related protein [Candidatus Acidiferrales bacterium]